MHDMNTLLLIIIYFICPHLTMLFSEFENKKMRINRWNGTRLDETITALINVTCIMIISLEGGNNFNCTIRDEGEFTLIGSNTR